jgi:acyl carrier protein
VSEPKAAEIARRLLAEALKLDAADVPDDAAIGTVARWDSLTHAALLLGLEAHLGHQISVEDMMKIESLQDVTRLLG